MRVPRHSRSHFKFCVISLFSMSACCAAPALAQHVRGPDFNGDGFADLAAGAPDEDLQGLDKAGLMHVIYGSNNGLKVAGNQVWAEDTPGVQGDIGALHLFGVSNAWGDFDGDGFDDLAIGAIGEDVNGIDFAGGVHVLYGSSHGLTAAGDQFWHQDVSGVSENAEDSDQFGAALAAGDFNGDGFADLAIGVPHESVGPVSDAGAVQILYGSANGLRTAGNQLWHQNRSGIADDAEDGDHFGASLITGDFDGDGFKDLAIGVPGESLGNAFFAGAVHILYGSSQGLRANRSQFWTQDSPGVLDSAETDDNFGQYFAAGDFDGDGRDDLAISAPRQQVGGIDDVGAVAVLYGSSNGLRAQRDQFWTEESLALADADPSGLGFGHTIATSDFNGDGRDDLAIGIPNMQVNGVSEAGAVRILYGSRSGLRADGSQLFTQNSAGIPDAAETEDRFGYAIAARDFDGDGRCDLAIAAPYEDLDGVIEAGLVHVLYGRNSGLSASGDQRFDQNSLSNNDEPAESGDEFGDYM